MAITVDNSLAGTANTSPSDASLAATARAGTVTTATPARATYTTAETIHSLTTVELGTGHHRDNTPRFLFPVPSGAWSARFYIRLPDLSASGNGAHEVRWILQAGNMGLVLHEASNGNVSARLQSTNLNASDATPSFSGTGITVTELTRIELSTDGVDTTVRFYRLHDDTDPYVISWTGVAPSTGVTAELTGYRYQRNHFMAYGNTTFSQDVADYQQFLMDLGYPAPQFGADGFYGDEMAAQWDGFAADYGMSQLVGTFGAGGSAGAEPLAAVDLAIDNLNSTATPPPVYLSHLAVGEGEWIGPAAAPAGTATGSLDLSASATGTKAGRGTATGPLSLAPDQAGTPAKAGNAAAEAEVDTTTDGHKATAGTADTSVEVAATEAGHKEAHGTASGDITVATIVEGTPGNRAQGAVEVTTAAVGHKVGGGTATGPMSLEPRVVGAKHAHGTARGSLLVSTFATQITEPIPAVSGTIRATGQLGGTARPSGRLAGTATRR